MTFTERQKFYLQSCENAVQNAADTLLQKGSRVSEAAAYSLLNGGKRVRGVLTLAVCDMLSGTHDAAQPFVAAIEMIHAFSLVHDDLPCMDNDTMRRGKPACHIAYGEDIALLAGDLLAIQAFESLSNSSASADSKVTAMQLLSYAAGAKGMILGQEMDLHNEKVAPDEQTLLETHRHKTGALIVAACHLGICAANKKMEQHQSVIKYAENIGLVFQIIDDILDETSTEEVLGKPIGSDVASGKTTFITLYGVEGSRKQAKAITDEAVTGLESVYGENANFLCMYARTLLDRIN